MVTSARMIVDLNIDHYRDLLTTEKDAPKRQTVARLLAEEEAKLPELLAQEKAELNSQRNKRR